MTEPDHLRWDGAWRERTWSSFGDHWDLVVVGGGIVGAGILRAAARAGVRALLLERRDFASGTSSRSSQLVHGGLRYLAQRQVGLTRSAVTERELLLRAAPGLVTPIDFLFPFYEGERAKRLAYAAALTAYDGFAGRRGRHGVSAPDFAFLSPSIHAQELIGGLRYREAQTDDARLVLRVLREAVTSGARALNHAPVTSLLRGPGGVAGVRVRDDLTGAETDVRATCVVNATGAWADELRAEVGGAANAAAEGEPPGLRGHEVPHLDRGQRRAPRDGRPITVAPWQGATLVGTTDIDHPKELGNDVAITPAEVDYLLALASPFRSLGLSRNDIVSTWSGVRPTVSTGAATASRELRAHVVWDEDGLLTVTGRKADHVPADRPGRSQDGRTAAAGPCRCSHEGRSLRRACAPTDDPDLSCACPPGTGPRQRTSWRSRRRASSSHWPGRPSRRPSCGGRPGARGWPTSATCCSAGFA